MIIEKGCGVVEKLVQFLNDNYSEVKINIICGNVYSNRIAKSIAEKVDTKISIFSIEDSVESINDILSKLDSNSVVLGVGGGKLMDISKELAFQKSLELILFPTIISNDGLANGLVVLNSVNNSKSIYRKPADYIFIDYNIIKAAPNKYLLSAIGDVFSNYSAINDFEYQRGSYSTKQFSEAKESVLKSLSIIESVTTFEVEIIVNAIVESAKAVEVIIKSSAISGSEHLILHSLEKLYPTKKVNHGIAVASITLFTLFLQGKLESKHLQFVKLHSIPNIFIDLFGDNRGELFRIFTESKNYRPNRITVLNKYKIEELIKQFILFEKKIQNIVL